MVFISMTIAQAQAAFLQEGGFDSGGMLRTEAAELSELEQELSRYVSEFLTTASDNLNKTNSITTGNLEKSLDFEIVPTKGGYLINFKALEYFKFVDKGVRGSVQSRKNRTSPYSFKNKMPPMSHIKKWIVDNGLVAKAIDVKKYGKTRRETKAINSETKVNTLAFLIARSIKNNGLTATNFWSDAFDETFKDFGQKMSTALGKTISVSLEQMKEDLANFKGKGAGKGVKIPT